MIATIISAAMIALGIFLLILCVRNEAIAWDYMTYTDRFRNKKDGYSVIQEIFGGLLCIGAVVNLLVALLVGYTGDHNDCSGKLSLEYQLENNLSAEVISQAEEYNKEVSKGNNYYCRFTLKKDVVIDIEKYLK